MAEDTNRNRDNQQSAERTQRKPETPGSVGLLEPGSAQIYSDFTSGDPRLGGGGSEVPPSVSASLLSDPNLNSRGNAPARIAAMQRMQQTYGNRAVQRGPETLQVPPKRAEAQEDESRAGR